MNVSIRPFTAADFPAWAALRNTLRPDHLMTVAELQNQDAQLGAKCFLLRIVAEASGELVGVGQINQETWRFHPQKFHIGIWVHPERQRQGIGGRLYDHMVAQVAPLHPKAFRASLREDNAAGLRFAAQRGFGEEMRAWTSRLDVAAFDPKPFAGVAERVLGQGIHSTTVADLQGSDPECWRKLYELDRSTGADLPGPEPFTLPTYAEWEHLVRYAPNSMPEAYFVARDGDRYVGVSNLTRITGSADLEVGYTAVERSYRGRGIALALKLQTIAFAQSARVPGIRTDNNSTNAPMLRINTALGFVRGMAWLTLLKG
jgi:GNAT superfamily N-acetyltransferase